MKAMSAPLLSPSKRTGSNPEEWQLRREFAKFVKYRDRRDASTGGTPQSNIAIASTCSTRPDFAILTRIGQDEWLITRV